MVNDPPTLGAIVADTTPALVPGPEPLKGQHVTLVRLTENHYAELYENMGAHDEVWTYLPDGPFSTSSDFFQSFNETLEISGLVIYTILPLSGPKKGRAVGLGFVLPESLSNRVAEIGVCYGPDLQKTTGATEVLFLLCSLLFDKLNYRRVQWKTNSFNLPSRKAAERIGLVHEGTFRQHQIDQGRNRDSSWYSMIDPEWPICRTVFEQWLDESNFDGQGRQKRRMAEIRQGLNTGKGY